MTVTLWKKKAISGFVLVALLLQTLTLYVNVITAFVLYFIFYWLIILRLHSTVHQRGVLPPHQAWFCLKWLAWWSGRRLCSSGPPCCPQLFLQRCSVGPWLHFYFLKRGQNIQTGHNCKMGPGDLEKVLLSESGESMELSIPECSGCRRDKLGTSMTNVSHMGFV